MLDFHRLAQDSETLFHALHRRGVDAAQCLQLKELDQERRSTIQRADALRRELNQASNAVQALARQGDRDAIQRARTGLQELKASIKAAEDSQLSAHGALEQLLLTIPNAPHVSVPDGADASKNRVERSVGTPRSFAFAPKAHWDLVERLGIVSFEQAGKISGARFAVYRGAGARLERALAAFMLDVAREHGFMEIAPPLLVRRDAMVGAGQFPKFEGESFETLEREFVLIPTSEVPLVNIHRDDIIDEGALPIRYAAYTPCFRREAGAAGKDTRGLIRQHQFNKVELVAYTTPEQSYSEHERLTSVAEAVLYRLELPYRVMALCTGDMGFAAAKTYDLEVWLPGQDAYREISSCSNCEDFQARRARIRYRPAGEGPKAKPRLLHTLNGSGVAVGRALVAVVENYQQEDGSLQVPNALVPYLNAHSITGV